MKKYYLILCLLPFYFSCVTQLSYIGNSFIPTKHVDVFVQESAVKNSYEVIGKGYIQRTYFADVEKIQEKAIEKAKEKGADAVLIKDYYIPGTGADINTTTRTDSIGKSLISLGHTTVQQTGSSGFNVWFLKYNKPN